MIEGLAIKNVLEFHLLSFRPIAPRLVAPRAVSLLQPRLNPSYLRSDSI